MQMSSGAGASVVVMELKRSGVTKGNTPRGSTGIATRLRVRWCARSTVSPALANALKCHTDVVFSATPFSGSLETLRTH